MALNQISKTVRVFSIDATFKTAGLQCTSIVAVPDPLFPVGKKFHSQHNWYTTVDYSSLAVISGNLKSLSQRGCVLTVLLEFFNS